MGVQRLINRFSQSARTHRPVDDGTGFTAGPDAGVKPAQEQDGYPGSVGLILNRSAVIDSVFLMSTIYCGVIKNGHNFYDFYKKKPKKMEAAGV